MPCLWVDKYDVPVGYKYIGVAIHNRVVCITFRFSFVCIEFEELAMCAMKQGHFRGLRENVDILSSVILRRGGLCVSPSTSVSTSRDNARRLRHGISQVIKGQLGGGPMSGVSGGIYVQEKKHSSQFGAL